MKPYTDRVRYIGIIPALSAALLVAGTDHRGSKLFVCNCLADTQLRLFDQLLSRINFRINEPLHLHFS